jgi:photosystem I P700 chlorophyll a apoprotein A1
LKNGRNRDISRVLAKGPTTTTWIGISTLMHMISMHTTDLEDISRKVFSAHFGQLGIIFIWLSGCIFTVLVSQTMKLG